MGTPTTFETQLQVAAKAIDYEVIPPLRQPIVSRKILYTNPSVKGEGVYNIDVTSMTEMSAGAISYSLPLPDADRDNVKLTRAQVQVPVISKNFQIDRMEWNAWQNVGTPIDTYAAQSAAYLVQKLEDYTVLIGNSTLGVTGLYTDAGNSYSTAKHVTTSGNAVAAIAGAYALINADNVYAPAYNLVLAPSEFNSLAGTLSTTGIPDIWYVMQMLNLGSGLADFVKPGFVTPGINGFTQPTTSAPGATGGIVGGNNTGGIYVTPSMTAATGLISPVDPGRLYGQLFVVQDMKTVLGYDSRAVETSPIYGSLYELIYPHLRQTTAFCQLTDLA